MFKETVGQLRSVFLNARKLDLPLLGLFVLINLIVLINALVHNPKIGYDAVHHLTYLQVLFDRLPAQQDTPEFFSPPLPYILPAVFDKACEIVRNDQPHIPLRNDSYAIFSCRTTDGKFAQYLNVLLSIATLYFVLLICNTTRPGNRFYKISTLALIAVLTVYYKTFSQVRGGAICNIFCCAFSIFVTQITCRAFPKKHDSCIRNISWLADTQPTMGVFHLSCDYLRGSLVAN